MLELMFFYLNSYYFFLILEIRKLHNKLNSQCNQAIFVAGENGCNIPHLFLISHSGKCTSPLLCALILR